MFKVRQIYYRVIRKTPSEDCLPYRSFDDLRDAITYMNGNIDEGAKLMECSIYEEDGKIKLKKIQLIKKKGYTGWQPKNKNNGNL